MTTTRSSGVLSDEQCDAITVISHKSNKLETVESTMSLYGLKLLMIVVGLLNVPGSSAPVPVADPIGTVGYVPESEVCKQLRAQYLAARALQTQIFVDLLESDAALPVLRADADAAEQVYQAAEADLRNCLQKYGANSKVTKDAQAFVKSADTVRREANTAYATEVSRNMSLQSQLITISQQIEDLKALLDRDCGGTQGQ